MTANRMTTEEALDFMIEIGGEIQSGDGTTDAVFAGDAIRVTVRYDGMEYLTAYTFTEFGNRERARFWRAKPLQHFDGRDGVLPEAELERRAGE